jgi:hypothetical protein
MQGIVFQYDLFSEFSVINNKHMALQVTWNTPIFWSRLSQPLTVRLSHNLMEKEVCWQMM